MFRNQLTHITRPIHRFALMGVFGICSILLCSCLEDTNSSDSENLEKLMNELNTAVLSDDESGLESVITQAKRLPQGTSAKVKNLILSTAQAKLGKINNKRISSETASTSIGFQQAVLVANQASKSGSR